ncbi:hypothetical protein V1283_007705 [Bradyrhizobium sp. AZCC 2262]
MIAAAGRTSRTALARYDAALYSLHYGSHFDPNSDTPRKIPLGYPGAKNARLPTPEGVS